MDSDSFFYQLISIFNDITISSPSVGAIVAIVFAALLLLLSAFASASEIAFFSLSPSDISQLEDVDTLVNKRVLNLLEDKERLLATILITNNFVNVTIVMLSNYFFMTVFKFQSAIAEFLILTVVLTFLLLLFGEIIPKIYSAQNALKFCQFSSSGILFCRNLFYPLSSALVNSTSFIGKYFKGSRTISVDELSHALELTDKREISDESNLLEGIIRFGGETVEEVMTSRLDVVDIDIKASFKEVLKIIRENNYSRMPIYQGSQDNIKGVLYIKDLLPHIHKSENFRWQTLIRPAFFVPETKMIDDLLRDFQANKVHIAIVVDEFGGTSGIVTMDDILSEIVGEIHDEYDDKENSYTKLDDKNWIFEAKTQLSDFYRITGLDEDVFSEVEGEADTIGGLLLELKGDFPKVHEKVTWKRYCFEVLAMDNRRILKVKFTDQGTTVQTEQDN